MVLRLGIKHGQQYLFLASPVFEIAGNREEPAYLGLHMFDHLGIESGVVAGEPIVIPDATPSELRKDLVPHLFREAHDFR
jgi:hypothetical protein